MFPFFPAYFSIHPVFFSVNDDGVRKTDPNRRQRGTYMAACSSILGFTAVISIFQLDNVALIDFDGSFRYGFESFPEQSLPLLMTYL